MNDTTWPDGVTGLDHTADVGLVVRAPALDQLFHRAAAGMMALVAGAEEEPTTVERRPSSVRGGAGSKASGRAPGEAASGAASAAGGERPGAAVSGAESEIALEAPDLEVLLVAWLREILHFLQARGLGYAGTRFDVLSQTGLAAHVSFRPSPPPVMELKGVTYHALAVRREDDGWFARVVFDV